LNPVCMMSKVAFKQRATVSEREREREREQIARTILKATTMGVN